MAPRKGGVDALQHHALHLVGRLDNGHFSGKILEVGDVGILFQFLQERLVLVERSRVVRIVEVVVGYADMRTHINHLFLDGLTVTGGDRKG